jgi:hypothetical protein
MRSEKTPDGEREQTNRPEPTPIPIQKPDYANTTKAKRTTPPRKKGTMEKGKKEREMILLASRRSVTSENFPNWFCGGGSVDTPSPVFVLYSSPSFA